MRKSETKHLGYEATRALVDNFRWFAGFKYRVRKISHDKFAVTCPRWCWSHFVLVPEDYR